MVSKCVIFGAGQTGRGFLAPILQENGIDITFIDKDKKLIQLLNEYKSYSVSFYNNKKPRLNVTHFEAYWTEDEHIVEILSEADLILTCVGANNISDLIPFIQKSLSKRKDENKLKILCCENGVNVKQPLIDNLENIQVSEAIIFCTTLKPKDNALDLDSEYYPELPYDHLGGEFHLPIKRFSAIEQFNDLIQRKIYTYNCLSAVISYLGFYKGYDIYADAANDDEISEIISECLPNLNRALSKKYDLSYEVQKEFSRFALNKFKNKSIVDTIERNGRNAERKLNSNERVVRPILIMNEYGEDFKILLLVYAAALFYGTKKKELTLKSYSFDPEMQMYKSKILDTVQEMEDGATLTEIIKQF